MMGTLLRACGSPRRRDGRGARARLVVLVLLSLLAFLALPLAAGVAGAAPSVRPGLAPVDARHGGHPDPTRVSGSSSLARASVAAPWRLFIGGAALAGILLAVAGTVRYLTAGLRTALRAGGLRSRGPPVLA